VSGVGGRGVLLPILVCVRDLRARWSGARLACLPSLREVVPYLTDCQSYSEVWLNYSTKGDCERVVTEAPRGRGSAWAVLSGPCLIVVQRQRDRGCVRRG